MSRVTFTYKSGRTRDMHRSQAEFLRVARQGTYLTRDMQAGPAGSQPPATDSAMPAAAPAPAPASKPAPSPAAAAPEPARVDLDALDIDALRALAQDRGVKVHHNAGVDKIREALRQAKA